MTDFAAGPGFVVVLLVIAGLYATVGQAGATGYLAVMGILGFDPLVAKPTALALNLVVSGIGTIQFARLGRLSWRAVMPFALLGLPLAALGGGIHLPAATFYPVVGVVLVFAALQMVRTAVRPGASTGPGPRVPPFWPAVGVGAAVGFGAGITGTGGGVFLAPAVLALGWLDIRQTAAVTAACNLVLSAAALAGNHAVLPVLPPHLPLWALVVAIGGLLGATLGARYLPERTLRLVLATILLASGARLIMT
jgi:uncharacterized membrane protein YfcA